VPKNQYQNESEDKSKTIDVVFFDLPLGTENKKIAQYSLVSSAEDK